MLKLDRSILESLKKSSRYGIDLLRSLDNDFYFLPLRINRRLRILEEKCWIYGQSHLPKDMGKLYYESRLYDLTPLGLTALQHK